MSARIVVLATLLAASPALVAQSTAEQSLGDAAISAKVKAALIDDEATKARQIDVETQSGVVQLSGFVESETSKSAAEEAARSVEGVQSVRNALIVRQDERTPGAVVDDSIIAAKVKSELATDAGLGTASAVNVEVRGGVVQLSGFVDSEDEKSRAEAVASTVDGVAEVRNDIDVSR
jgi:hyperosmotically inducible protein